MSGRGGRAAARRCRRCLPRRPQRTPDAAAVVFEDRALSYAALDAHANRLAHHLQGLGVGPETVVGLCVERSPEMVVGLLGILKAGGAYLPLDPNYPRERLAFMLADAGCPVLVTQQALLERLPRRCGAGAAGARIVRLDADWPAIARQPDTAPHARSRSAPPRLCHLHLGLDRNAEGRRGEPRRVEQLPRLDGGAGAADARTTGCSPSPPSASTSRRSSFTCRCSAAPRSRSRRARPCRMRRLLARTIGDEPAPPSCRRRRRCGRRCWPTAASGCRTSNGLAMLTGGEPLPGELARALAAHGRELDQSLRPDRDHDLVRRHDARSR